MVWVDRDGAVIDTIGLSQRGITGPALSPDGTRVAFSAGEASQSPGIWIHDLNRGTSGKLTFDPRMGATGSGGGRRSVSVRAASES